MSEIFIEHAEVLQNFLDSLVAETTHLKELLKLFLADLIREITVLTFECNHDLLDCALIRRDSQ